MIPYFCLFVFKKKGFVMRERVVEISELAEELFDDARQCTKRKVLLEHAFLAASIVIFGVFMWFTECGLYICVKTVFFLLSVVALRALLTLRKEYGNIRQLCTHPDLVELFNKELDRRIHLLELYAGSRGNNNEESED